MNHEPLNYVIEYEVGALVIFLVIMLHYLMSRRFPSQKSRMYSTIICTTVIYIILDVGGSLIIRQPFVAPLAVIHLTNGLFYAVTVLLLMLMMLYTLALVRHIDKKLMIRIFPLLIPGIALWLLLLINPFTKLFFFVDPVEGFIHGKLFILIYIVSFVYLLFTLIIALQNQLKLRRQEFTTIMIFLAAISGATVFQFFVPSVLVIGIGIMFAVGLMYFTLQNPDSMMDVSTDAFTYEAMLTFLKNCMQGQDYVQIVAIKIHNMSRINELLGIESGSVLLKQVCGCMRESSRDVWVFRMRGSCFVAITHNKNDYRALNEHIRQNISQVWRVGNTEVLLQASVCSLASDELFESPITSADTVKLLETAFSQKNNSGERIGFVTIDAELIKKYNRKKDIETALRYALSTGEGLDLYFQPLWSVSEKRFTSAEVLLRFIHPTLGSISPNEFILIAESNGFVTELDEWVVRKSCEMIEKNHFTEIGIERLEINLSALEFMHRRLPELLNDIMKCYSVKPSFLCFEITETAATESYELLKDCMQKICGYGCTFALDDYGTGYANISRVLGLPFSVIKLDKSLLYHSGEVIADMSGMFSHMNRNVVVEGVETEKQAQLCNISSIKYIQGFYYAKPMNQQDFLEFMKNTALYEPL